MMDSPQFGHFALRFNQNFAHLLPPYFIYFGFPYSFQPSPFFVLDEIDAALDRTNVDRVARYIREHTRDDGTGFFQSIVISLKETFYEKADALVGVCRDGKLGCSNILTFDLNRFD